MKKIKQYDTANQIAIDIGINKTTICDYARRGEIRMHSGLYNKEDCLKLAEQIKTKKRQSNAASGSRERKTDLECDRLEVVIEKEREYLDQAKLETARQRGEMLLSEDVRRRDRQMIEKTRSSCESWRAEQTARSKSAKEKKAIDGLANGFLETMMRELETWEVEA